MRADRTLVHDSHRMASKYAFRARFLVSSSLSSLFSSFPRHSPSHPHPHTILDPLSNGHAGPFRIRDTYHLRVGTRPQNRSVSRNNTAPPRTPESDRAYQCDGRALKRDQRPPSTGGETGERLCQRLHLSREHDGIRRGDQGAWFPLLGFATNRDRKRSRETLVPRKLFRRSQSTFFFVSDGR